MQNKVTINITGRGIFLVLHLRFSIATNAIAYMPSTVSDTSVQTPPSCCSLSIIKPWNQSVIQLDTSTSVLDTSDFSHILQAGWSVTLSELEIKSILHPPLPKQRTMMKNINSLSKRHVVVCVGNTITNVSNNLFKLRCEECSPEFRCYTVTCKNTNTNKGNLLRTCSVQRVQKTNKQKTSAET